MRSNITIDKAALLQDIIRKLEEEVVKLDESFKEAKVTSIEAPGRMQSRYDTMGVEAAWVADGLAKTIEEKVEGIGRLKNLRLPENPERVSVGCIVGIGPPKSNVEILYFILPASGGMLTSMETGYPDVQTVMAQAPVAQALMGKFLHDAVFLKGRAANDFILYIA